MSVFLTKDRSAYRRWINVIPSLILPGSGHFLAGRRCEGMIWFLGNVCARIVYLFFYSTPFIKSDLPTNIAQVCAICLWLVTIIHGSRNPIPRLKFKAWVALGLLAVAIPILPLLAVRQFFFQPFSVPARSMQPTLMGNNRTADGQTIEGDHIFVNKWVYRFHNPKRGDLITFRTEGIDVAQRDRFRIPNKTIYVKRLVGLPGEKISIRPPYIYINGEKLIEPKIFETICVGGDGFEGLPVVDVHGGEMKEISLGTDEFYVLGDNLKNSLDSRFFGGIKQDSVIGNVGWIYWPPERRGFPE